MPIQLVAIDMDDTLIDEKGAVSPEASGCIRDSIGRGVKVTLATGRMFQSAVPYAKKLGLDVPLITYNGALIRSGLSDEIILHEPVPYDLSRDVVKYAQEKGLTLNLYVDDRLIVAHMNDEVEYYATIAGVVAHAVGDLGKYISDLATIRGEVNAVSTKLLIVADSGIVDASMRELSVLFDGRLNITKSKPRFLEMTKPGISKAAAIKMLIKKWSIEQDQVMAIGDSLNDLEMLEFAGIGVAVANALPEVKQRADCVTQHECGLGVAEAFRRFIV